MTKKCQNKLKPKGWCNKPTKLQFQSILNTENFDALQTLRINRNSTHSVVYSEVCCPSKRGKLFIATRLFVKINFSYFNAFSLSSSNRGQCMTEAPLNANNFMDICSNPSNFHMCMYVRMKNIYAHNLSCKHCFCVWKVVHNRTF